jgi:hypothetical protein
VVVTLIGLFFITFFVSVVYGMAKLCRPGIGAEVRQVVIIRHTLTGLCIRISLVYLDVMYIFNSLNDLFDIGKEVEYHELPDEWFMVIFKWLFYLQGFITLVPRLTEPFFFQVIASEVRKLFRST